MSASVHRRIHQAASYESSSCTIRYALVDFDCVLHRVDVRAQSPDQRQNLFACKNGWDSCVSSGLTQDEKNEVASAKHEQNLSTVKTHPCRAIDPRSARRN